MASLLELALGAGDDAPLLPATTSVAARLLAQPASRAALLARPEVVARFAELLQHPDREARLGERGERGGAGCAATMQLRCPLRAPLLTSHSTLLSCAPPLLCASSSQVVRAADAALDAVAAGGEEWGASVRRLRFEAFNREWLQVVQAEDAAAALAAAGSSGGDGQQQGEGIGAYDWGSPTVAAA